MTKSKDSQMPHYRTSMTYKVECLKALGYDKEFQICEEGLRCLNTGEIFQPEDLKIMEHSRFEGVTNPDDMAILYAVETESGLKGVIIDAFGIYGDADLFQFMKQVKDMSRGVTYNELSCENINKPC